jgi:hypothetical protein
LPHHPHTPTIRRTSSRFILKPAERTREEKLLASGCVRSGGHHYGVGGWGLLPALSCLEYNTIESNCARKMQMLAWLKSFMLRRYREPNASDVSKIIAKYGELLEKHPAAYMDESWLPASKEKMRLAFRAAWKIAPTAEMRSYVEVVWPLLSMFQPGIGSIPVDAAERDGTPESLKMLNEYLKLCERTKAESDRDYAEMNEFVRANFLPEPRLPRVKLQLGS